jgi:hypothetical protein
MGSRAAIRHRGGMTTLAAPAAPLGYDSPAPSLPRLLASGLVAVIGVIVLSIAVGNFVVGSSPTIVPAQTDVAQRLVAATPIVVVLGLLHLLAAVILAWAGDGLRLVAVLAAGLASLAAASSAAMLAAGVDPFGVAARGHGTTGEIGLLIVAAILYGTAAVAGGSGSPEA